MYVYIYTYISHEHNNIPIVTMGQLLALVHGYNHKLLHGTKMKILQLVAIYNVCIYRYIHTLYIATNCNIVVFMTVCIYRYMHTLYIATNCNIVFMTMYI